MPVNLGIDCSTKWISLGLSENGSITAEIHLNAGRKQASCLPAACSPSVLLPLRALPRQMGFDSSPGAGYFVASGESQAGKRKRDASKPAGPGHRARAPPAKE